MRRQLAWCLGCLFLAFAQPVAAQQDIQLAEQKIKVGLLYNFLKYTNWPPGGGNMTVCVFGADPFEGSLQPMQGRSVNQREIVVRIIGQVAEATSCQMIFVNADEKDRWNELHQFLAGRPVLTVSDYSGFIRNGGMIEFGRNDNHIEASLNTEAARAVGLAIQPRLLNLVKIVGGGQ